jgi:integrase
MTVRTYAESWIERVRATRRPSTVTVYRSTMRVVVRALGGHHLDGLRRRDVIAFADGLVLAGRSANYVRAIVRVLSALYTSAIDDELVTANPTVGVARRYAHAVRMGGPIARAHLPLVLATVGVVRPDLLGLLTTMVQTGLRLGEALALQWHRVDLDGRRLHVERTWLDRRDGPCKGGEARTIHLFPETTALLAVVPRMGLYVFPGPHGTPHHRCQIQRAFGRIVRRAGLLEHRYTPHSARHTFATLAVEGGYPLEWVQAQLGHKSIEITRRLYARFAQVPRPGTIADRWSVLVRHGVESATPAASRRVAPQSMV